METDYVQTQCVLADGADRFGIAAVAFDQHEELLWMGNEGGHVTSYYGGHMQKYTSFQVHASQDIRQLTTIDEGILALTATNLRCQMRRGIPLFTYNSANMLDMQCMLQLSQDRIIIGGHQEKLIDFNLTRCKESNVVNCGSPGCVMLRAHSRLVCCGDPIGRISLRDPASLAAEHTLDTHSGSLSDFDVQGNLLVTCGFSARQGNLSVDRFLMVYDLRMMRAVTPMQVNCGSAGCVMLRAHSRLVCCGDPIGRISLRDPASLAAEHTLDTHSGSLSDFDVQGNLLVTCGFSARQGNLSVDRFLMVYDLRMMRAVTPMQVNCGSPGCVMLRAHSRLVCCGDPIGRISLRDPASLAAEHTLDTHSGSLSDFDVQGNLLVTCGFSARQGNLSVDRFLMVYDLRMMRAVTPMQVNCGSAGCVMLRAHSRLVCCGDPIGRISLRDPASLAAEHTLDTHSGSLSDFDVQGNLLVTCGFSARQGNLSVDRFLMVYDLRMMRAVTPMQVVLDPLFLRFLPSVSSRLAVVSTLGQVQLVDTVALSEPRLCLYQVDNPGSMCTTFDVSTSSQAMAFGDSTGSIHLFVSADEPMFNSFSRMTEHADPVDSFPSFGVDDLDTPYSAIPLPVTHDATLASDWPAQFMQNVYRRTPAIDQDILRTMKIQGPIGYAPNPKSTRRNQVAYILENYGSNVQVNKLFGSDKLSKSIDESGFVAIPKRYRRVDIKYSKLGNEDFPFDQYNKTGLPGLEATLPNAYCNAMLQVLFYIEPLKAALLSHLCPKEFCLSCELGFLFHMLCTSRGTPCQPGNFLRAFRTVPEASALGLILSDLHPEAKMKTDLGALIQSWNRFILHQMHCELMETKKRKLEEKAAKKESKPFVYKETDFPSILGSDTSTRLKKNNNQAQETVAEDAPKPPLDTEISTLFSMSYLQQNTCLKCSHEVRKESIQLACNLVYPSTAAMSSAADAVPEEWSFCDLLATSLCPQQTTPAWCDACGKFSPTSQAKIVQSLPGVVVVNTGLHNQQYRRFWQAQMDNTVAKAQSTPLLTPTPVLQAKPCRYGSNCSRPGCRFRHGGPPDPPATPSASPVVPTNPQTPVQPAGVTTNPYYNNSWLPHDIVMQLDEDKALRVVKDEDKDGEDGLQKQKYSLSAVVCFINDQQAAEKRNIVSLIKIKKNADFAWYLFNDISISAVSAQEAVWFSLDWKVPCVLYYSSQAVLSASTTITPAITQDVFGEDKCLARSGGTSGITFTPLAAQEMPRPGELVAMDAEFVTLNQEEAELRSDGKMSTIKPSHMSVARITCIRGQGPMEGTPFIDDYISTQEQVVDYLTKFSGIKPGDLDANFSSKHLTTLKSTYQKLRFLQDSGAVFVGHGLKNDFRVINLVVPPEQVVDTVLLFHLPHHRMVSLRFLAWHFLGLKIQSETHDSVEDARAALQLYKRYKELEADKKLTQALQELYETGKMLTWRVPED